MTAQIVDEREIKMETGMDDDVEKDESNIVLNSTSEFCRTLGDIPTYGQSGNRDEEKEELMVGAISRQKVILYANFNTLSTE